MDIAAVQDATISLYFQRAAGGFDFSQADTRLELPGEALARANGTHFGLSGSVWTSDVEAGIDVARQVRTGTYGINQFGTLDMRNPFGGFKASGHGRELSAVGMREFLNAKTVVKS